LNRLLNEKSPYLKHAASQPVDWFPYSEAAFEKARKEGKPVFLSSGAVWCHWCHVQAKESFEDPQVARILNENFISIKLDRDERPDVDRRYQESLHLLGQGGGWPLSIFLTPEGKPFYGGTYFPPEDSFGRPGFKKVLLQVAGYYREKKDKAEELGEKLIKHLAPAPIEKTPISEGMLAGAAAEVLSHFDPENGGFGTMPKFPMPGAISFLIGRHFFAPRHLRDQGAYEMAIKKTLTNMAKGGIYDQLGGGFHRYSTDEAWIVPHFEKLAEDNAWHLKNYTEAYSLLGEPLHKQIAQGIIEYISSTLSDPRGGFYASQDADLTPEDEGGYFTWTSEDFERVLAGKELKAASMHFLHERGSMHHDPSKKTLFIAHEPEEIAVRLGLDSEEARALLKSAKEKLLRERNKREAPFVDKTFYSSINGLMTSSYLFAWRAFGDDYLLQFALMSLKRMLTENYGNGVLMRTSRVRGMLDDYVHLTGGCLDAYETIGETEYLKIAEELLNRLVEDFYDRGSGGFFDSGEAVLGVRLKNIEDIPHPSPNALLIWHLVRMGRITGNEKYAEIAEECLSAFAGQAAKLGPHGGSFYSALDGFYNFLSLKVEDRAGGFLAKKSLETYRPYKVVSYGEENGIVVPCRRGECLEPVRDIALLENLLRAPRA